MSQLQVTGEAKIRDLQGPVVANSGVISALDGAASQYVRGDGTLADFPTQTGGGSSVSYYLNGSVNQGTFGGSTYYQMSRTAIIGTGANFSTSANGLLAQFITDVNDPDATSVPSGNWNIEFYLNVSAASGATASFYAEFYKYDGTTFTLLASNVATPEYLTGTTTIDAYFTSVAFPESALATTDRLAIRIYANVASKTVTLYTQDNRLAQIVTTFSKGILSLNNLTDQQQYFATGASGSDFNIASSVDIHTFNLPTASATNRGLLSTTDWSTFNSKQPAGNYVTIDTTQTISAAKTFSNTITFSDYALMNIGVALAKTSGTPLYASTNGYANLQLVNAGSVNSLYLNDGDTLKSIKLSFNNAADYTYTYPAITGTLALLEGTQTFSGVKTFTGNYFNLDGNGTAGNALNIKQYASNFAKGVGYSSIGALDTNKFSFYLGNTSAFDSRQFILDGSNITINTVKTFSLPDLSGTLALLEGSQTFSGSKSFTAFTSFTGLTTRLSNGLYFDKGGSPSALTTTTTNLYSEAGNNNIVAQDNGNKSKLQFQVSSDYTYTFPAATGTLALTSDLSSYVTLGTSQTISGQKTFSVQTNFAAKINATNNQGVGFFNTGSTFETVLYPSIALSANRQVYLPNATGTLALTSDLSSYLPLAGGTLTGALNGTSAYFSAGVQSTGYYTADETKYVVPTGVSSLTTLFVSGGATFSSNVGVGGTFTSGYGLLQVNASASYTTIASLIKLSSGANSYTNRQSVFEFGQGGTNPNGYSHQISASTAGTAANNTLNFALCNGGETTRVNVLTLLGTGNVGIGTSSPSYPLTVGQAGSTTDSYIQIASTTTGTGNLFFGDATGGGTASYSGYIQYQHSVDAMVLATSNTERMRITSNGNIGMPTTYGFTTSNAANLFIDSGGGLLYRSTSSLKYKTEVEDLNIDTTDLLSKMRPVWYRSLGNVDRKDWSWYGFIAEELAEIEPRLVHFGYGKDSYEEVETTDDEGNSKIETKLKDNAVKDEPDGVQYERITVLLVAEMQKMRKEIEELKAKIK